MSDTGTQRRVQTGAKRVRSGPSPRYRVSSSVGSSGQADFSAPLITRQQIDRVFPKLSDVGERLGRKAAIEEGCGPVQVLQIEGVVEYVANHDTRHTVVVARRQDRCQDGFVLTAGNHDVLALGTVLPRRMRARATIGKQAEFLHELEREIVAEKRNIVLSASHFKELLSACYGRLTSSVQGIPALLDVHQDGIAQVIGIEAQPPPGIDHAGVQAGKLDHLLR